MSLHISGGLWLSPCLWEKQPVSVDMPCLCDQNVFPDIECHLTDASALWNITRGSPDREEGPRTDPPIIEIKRNGHDFGIQGYNFPGTWPAKGHQSMECEWQWNTNMMARNLRTRSSPLGFRTSYTPNDTKNVGAHGCQNARFIIEKDAACLWDAVILPADPRCVGEDARDPPPSERTHDTDRMKQTDIFTRNGGKPSGGRTCARHLRLTIRPRHNGQEVDCVTDVLTLRIRVHTRLASTWISAYIQRPESGSWDVSQGMHRLTAIFGGEILQSQDTAQQSKDEAKAMTLIASSGDGASELESDIDGGSASGDKRAGEGMRPEMLGHPRRDDLHGRGITTKINYGRPVMRGGGVRAAREPG
ncbi:hypothetical protein C8R44DRAFT_753107 [Mycena epipterygia]|nr:hypothetical protein C8R44DRAFT_753107 [Mycena epipterygia]